MRVEKVCKVREEPAPRFTAERDALGPHCPGRIRVVGLLGVSRSTVQYISQADQNRVSS